MKCPQCAKPIAFDATSHPACGWNVREPEQKRAASAEYEKMKQESAAQAQREAEAFLIAHALDTQAEQRAYRREHAPKFGVWSRERIIAHWQSVIDGKFHSDNPELTRAIAHDALRRLRSAPATRQPGEDDA